MEVKTLGSVSPYPKDDKNGVSYLVKSGNHKILLDSGAGSSRLLNMEEDLNDLIIIISHLHKDHYPGLLDIGYASYVNKNLGYLKDKIKVYIPCDDEILAIENYEGEDGFRYRRSVTKKLPDYEYLINFGEENYLEFIDYKSIDLKLDDIKITSAKNPHQLSTHSIKIEDLSSTLVYSADTGYKNNSLKAFAKDADLFICESTFLKGQPKKGDNHLYAYEAGLIANSANVKELMLTHFYPEIDKQKYVDEAAEEFSGPIRPSIEGEVIKLGGIK